MTVDVFHSDGAVWLLLFQAEDCHPQNAFQQDAFQNNRHPILSLKGFYAAPGLKMPAMMCTEANRRPDALRVSKWH